MVRTRRTLRAFTLFLVVAVTAGLFLGHAHHERCPDPQDQLDMVTTGNTYDDTTNTMVVGAIESCSSTAAPGNNATLSTS